MARIRKSSINQELPCLLLLLLSALPCSTCGSILDEVSTRIVGGESVNPSRYPYFAFLKMQKSTLATSLSCGGTLIHRDIVLTAAHCGDEGLFEAHATLNYTKSGRPTGFEFDVGVDGWLLHPNWDRNTTTNDLMVLRLEQSAPLRFMNTQTGSYGMDLNHDRQVPQDGQLLTVIGAGLTSAVGTPSNTLDEVEVEVIDYETCNGPRSYSGAIVRDIMLCAGSPQGGKDACFGDSGGPIMVRGDGWETDLQVGIVSTGYGCGRESHPGVYATISPQVNWINRAICELSVFPPEGCGESFPSPAPTVMPSLAPVQYLPGTTEGSWDGNVTIHDPSSMVRTEDGTLVVMGTGRNFCGQKGLAYKYILPNSNTWVDGPQLFGDCDAQPSWIPRADNAEVTLSRFRAPTLRYSPTFDFPSPTGQKQWVLYYSLRINTNDVSPEDYDSKGQTCIGRATGAGTPTDLRWLDDGVPIYCTNVRYENGIPSGLRYNNEREYRSSVQDIYAFDPSILVTSDGETYLVWGSGYVYMAMVDPTTGRLEDAAQSKTYGGPALDPAIGQIADSTRDAYEFLSIGADALNESPYILEVAVNATTTFYYLFVNWFTCCEGVDSTAEIRMGRSSTGPKGPYLDKNDLDMRLRFEQEVNGVEAAGGTLLFGSNGRYRGPGQVGVMKYTSALTGQAKMVLSFHFYDAEDNGLPRLGARELSIDSEGWPTLSEEPWDVCDATGCSSPTPAPVRPPTTFPSSGPTTMPSASPTSVPTGPPTVVASAGPSSKGSNVPTIPATDHPSSSPSFSPTITASVQPTITASDSPTNYPSSPPSEFPTTLSPTVSPAPTSLFDQCQAGGLLENTTTPEYERFPAVPEGSWNGEVVLHDPSRMVYTDDGYLVVFGSGQGFCGQLGVSSKFIEPFSHEWVQAPQIFGGCDGDSVPEWIPGVTTLPNFESPAVLYSSTPRFPTPEYKSTQLDVDLRQWVMYYSVYVSTDDDTTEERDQACIGRATATGTPDNLVWADDGKPVFCSNVNYDENGFPTSKRYTTVSEYRIYTSDTLAMDPSITLDSTTSDYFLSWGNGIVNSVRLDPNTGHLESRAQSVHCGGPCIDSQNDAEPNTQVAFSSLSVGVEGHNEAPFIFERNMTDGSIEHFLFVNWFECCKGLCSTYEIRMGRSTSGVRGPYLDRDGNSMRLRYQQTVDGREAGGGTLLLAGEGRYRGPGHAGVMTYTGVGNEGTEKMVFSFHFYDADERGLPKLGAREMTFDEEGWPKLSSSPWDLCDLTGCLTLGPSTAPVPLPTLMPSESPSAAPTDMPSEAPTSLPTGQPTTAVPTVLTTIRPSTGSPSVSSAPTDLFQQCQVGGKFYGMSPAEYTSSPLVPEGSWDGDISIHDPSSLIYTEDGYLVVFGSGLGFCGQLGASYRFVLPGGSTWQDGPQLFGGCGPEHRPDWIPGPADALLPDFEAPTVMYSPTPVYPTPKYGETQSESDLRQWVMYYSLKINTDDVDEGDRFLLSQACIGRATATGMPDNLEWVDDGKPVYCSNVKYDENGHPKSLSFASADEYLSGTLEGFALDPSIIEDPESGRTYLTWGDGVIQSAWIDPLTGHLSSEFQGDSCGGPCKESRLQPLSNFLFYTTLSIGTGFENEAPYILDYETPDGTKYHYLFVNWYDCCLGVCSTAEIRMGRSTDGVLGKYRDRDGLTLDGRFQQFIDGVESGGGSVLLQSDGRYRGPGSVGVLKYTSFSSGEAKMVMTFHWYDAEEDGLPKLAGRELTIDADGWPVLASEPWDICDLHGCVVPSETPSSAPSPFFTPYPTNCVEPPYDSDPMVDEGSWDGDVSIHDPSSVIQTSDGYLVVFGSGQGFCGQLGIGYKFVRPNTSTWQQGPQLFGGCTPAQQPDWIPGPDNTPLQDFESPEVLYSATPIFPTPEYATSGDDAELRQWVMYYSVYINTDDVPAANRFDMYQACIGRATATGGVENLVWVDDGKPVYCSNAKFDQQGFPVSLRYETKASYNDATDEGFGVDPSVIKDGESGDYYMSFGSGRIYMVKLDQATGHIATSAHSTDCGGPCLDAYAYLGQNRRFFTYISYGPAGVGEASYVLEDSSSGTTYHFLFVNWLDCCEGSCSTYQIRIGRSTNGVQGPYLDKNQYPMARRFMQNVDGIESGGGTLFLGSEGRYRGPGHSGVMRYTNDAGEEKMVFSFYFNDAAEGGLAKLGGRELVIDSDGWPVISSMPWKICDLTECLTESPTQAPVTAQPTPAPVPTTPAPTLFPTTLGPQHTPAPNTGFPPCFICGDENSFITNPDGIVETPVLEPVACSVLDLFARFALVDPETCAALPSFTRSICQCTEPATPAPVSPSISPSSFPSAVPSSSPTSGESQSPSAVLSMDPSASPSTPSPSIVPSSAPTTSQSQGSTVVRSMNPTRVPSGSPSVASASPSETLTCEEPPYDSEPAVTEGFWMGDVSIHEPSSLIQTSDGYLVVFGSGRGFCGQLGIGYKYIRPGTISWVQGPQMFGGCSESEQPAWIPGSGPLQDFEAPEILYSPNPIFPTPQYQSTNNPSDLRQWVMYYSVHINTGDVPVSDRFSLNQGCIGRATATGNVENLVWVDDGKPVYCSNTNYNDEGIPDSTRYNTAISYLQSVQEMIALEPTVTRDVVSTDYYLTWGSGFVYTAKLNATTGHLVEDAHSALCGGPCMDSTSTPSNNRDAYSLLSVGAATFSESPFIFDYTMSNGQIYHYLFVNWFECCKGACSQSQIRLGRSSTGITGTYVDKDGLALDSRFQQTINGVEAGGGSLFFESEGRYRGPGHAGVFHYNSFVGGTEKMVLSFYFFDQQERGIAKLGARELAVDEDGWPVLSSQPWDFCDLIGCTQDRVIPPTSSPSAATPAPANPTYSRLSAAKTTGILPRPLTNDSNG